MGVRALSVMEAYEDDVSKKTVYISWLADKDGFSALCLDSLKESLEVFLDEGNVICHDPTERPGEQAVGKLRSELEKVTDFVSLVTNKYLIDAKEKCKDPEHPPEILAFINRKVSSADPMLRMWLFPLENIPLRLVAIFKGRGIPSLDFPWWHGTEEIAMPKPGDFAAEQRFKNEITRRAAEIVDAEHPRRCGICGAKPTGPMP